MQKALAELIQQYPITALFLAFLAGICVAIIVGLSLLSIFKEEQNPSYKEPTNRLKNLKNFLKLNK